MSGETKPPDKLQQLRACVRLCMMLSAGK